MQGGTGGGTRCAGRSSRSRRVRSPGEDCGLPRSLALALLLGGLTASGCPGSLVLVGDGGEEAEAPDADAAPDVTSEIHDAEPDAPIADGEADGADGDVDRGGDDAAMAEDGGGLNRYVAIWMRAHEPTEGSVTGHVLCACDAELPLPSFVWFDDGTCSVETLGTAEDWSRCRPLDFGTASVEVGETSYPLIGSVFAPVPCIFGYETEPPVAAPGTEVRFVCTGGSDVPPFDVTLVVPPPVSLVEPVAGSRLSTGGPWTVAWDPPDADTTVGFSLFGDTRSVSCTTTSPSPLVVSFDVAGAWYESDTWADADLVSVREWWSIGDPTIWLQVQSSRSEIFVTF